MKVNAGNNCPALSSLLRQVKRHFSPVAQGTTQGCLMWHSHPQTVQCSSARQTTSLAGFGARMALAPLRCDLHATLTCMGQQILAASLCGHTLQCKGTSAPALITGMSCMLKLCILPSGSFLPWAQGLSPARELGTLWHPACIRSAAWSSLHSLLSAHQTLCMQRLAPEVRDSSDLVCYVHNLIASGNASWHNSSACGRAASADTTVRLWRFGNAEDDQQGPHFGAEEVQCLEVHFPHPGPKSIDLSAGYSHFPGAHGNLGSAMALTRLGIDTLCCYVLQIEG